MKRAAVYCRVSTDSYDQANSLQAQRRYFSEYVQKHPEWQLYEIYADEGISGTSAKRRLQFLRMIDDAHSKKFDLIITKEVSRFSRNILDTITYTRELKSIGVGVIFMNDGINTLEPDAELRLSIMASIAQEESRKTSSRVKWGQSRQMERGVVFGHSLLGYDVKDGIMTVNPNGASLVRLIFHKYGVEKKSASAIARELNDSGYPTCGKSTRWTGGQILKILRNEKYMGDLVQKKTYTPDYLSHEKKANHGEEAYIILREHHEAIIDSDLWNAVQEQLAKQSSNGRVKSGHSGQYMFSGKIKCGECGANFVCRTKVYKDGSSYKRWCCSTATREGAKIQEKSGIRHGCDVGFLLRDDIACFLLKQSLECLELDCNSLAQSLAAIVCDAAANRETEDVKKNLDLEINLILSKKDRLLDAFISNEISKEEMRTMCNYYDKMLADNRERLKKLNELASMLTLEDAQNMIKNIMLCVNRAQSFGRHLLRDITVYKDRQIMLRLNNLSHNFVFAEE